MRTLDDIKPGQTIGRYEFLVPIAKGGMASVWAARLKGTRGFAKTVAIKTILPTLSDDPLFEQMFLDEAQIAAQIHHPNVVEIMDLGEENDVLYQVMEYVDGEPLTAIMRAVKKKKQRVPVEIAVKIIIDACMGLHAAHELKSVDGTLVGLVHRDISPQNIMLAYDGTVKLVDFGVAKAAGRTASETTTGQLKGKAPYMAPEQTLGQKVDRCTDIFAMGIVLYQLTTGKHPFRGENDIATLHNILHKDVPSPRFVDSKFPRPLEVQIHRALARDAGNRFATAKEMGLALLRVFPPTQRRVEASDVGAFLQDLLGVVGNKRRTALAEAIKRADRAIGERSGSMNESPGSLILSLSDIGSDESSIHGLRITADQTDKIDLNVQASIGGEAARQSKPSMLSLEDKPAASGPLLQEETGADRRPSAFGESTPGTVPAAMVNLQDTEPAPTRIGPKVAIIGLILVAAIGVTWLLSQRQGDEENKQFTAAPGTSATATPKPIDLPESGEDSSSDAPVYDLESISELVQEELDAAPSTQVGRRRTVATLPSTAEKRSTATAPSPAVKPKATTRPRATTTAMPPESTWTPPPVSDPGF